MNPRSRTNCSQCGAVMLGVAAVDIADLVRSNRPTGGETAPSRSEKQQELVRLARQAVAEGKPIPKAPGVGCSGCLLRMLGGGVVAVGYAGYVIAKKNPDRSMEEVVEELGKKLDHTLHPRSEPPPPLPAPPVVPHMLPVAPAAVLPEPITTAETLKDADEMGPREKAIVALIDLRLDAVRACANLGHSRKTPVTHLMLRVTYTAMGNLSALEVAEPIDVSLNGRVCLRALLRQATIAPGTESTQVEYTWDAAPKP